jgi:alpha-glucosidase
MFDRYSALTGRPILLPEWAYGLTWINNYHADQSQVSDDAWNFRQLKFLVDEFGLEPGWMKEPYDYSTNVEWNVDKFYELAWLRGRMALLGASSAR